MPQLIQIRKRVAGTGAPAAGALLPGELAYNSQDSAVQGALYVGDGVGGVQTLVDSSRQVELTGIQTIVAGPANLKTFDIAAPASANLSILGGAAGGLLTTDGLGVLSWGGAATLPATDAEMVAGLLNNVYASPLNMMALMGDVVTNLTTTALTVVPAINELKTRVDLQGLAGVFVGSFDAVTGVVTGTAASGIVGTLPPPSLTVPPPTGNRGWYLICDVNGANPPVGAPAGTYEKGDWLISDGATWTHLAYGGISTITAAGVPVVPPLPNPAGPGDDVQEVLEYLMTAKIDDAPDDVRLWGRRGPGTSAWEHAVSALGDSMQGNLQIQKADPLLTLQKPASGSNCSIIGQTDFLNRWSVIVGDSGIEAGTNSGSNFAITRFADGGAPIDVPLWISRQTGIVDFEFPPTINGNPITAAVVVTAPELVGDGTAGAPITFTGITTDPTVSPTPPALTTFLGLGLSTDPLILQLVDGGVY